ncbi:protein of unknown function [Blastococcus saxobsidens DD2]|uniref:Uncharacterized protein n=1 Tax=Blastococcus saxobsidens (strain DD2) TaxID=1146883 RepID=H6RRM4_BLASD|nr:protein of unknown function [Blastococcus saxobsidens DD2]
MPHSWSLNAGDGMVMRRAHASWRPCTTGSSRPIPGCTTSGRDAGGSPPRHTCRSSGHRTAGSSGRCTGTRRGGATPPFRTCTCTPSVATINSSRRDRPWSRRCSGASRWAPSRRTLTGAPCSRVRGHPPSIPVLVRGAAVTDRLRLTSTGGATDTGSTHRPLHEQPGQFHFAGFPTTRPTPVAPGGGGVGRRPIPKGRAALFRRPALPDTIPWAVGEAVLPGPPPARAHGHGDRGHRGGLDGGQSAFSPHSVRRTSSRDPPRP